VFASPVTASHWAPDAFVDTSVGDQSEGVSQVDPNTLLWLTAPGDFTVGDIWAFDTVADNADPEAAGTIS
jgi:hypothetical protein